MLLAWSSRRDRLNGGLPFAIAGRRSKNLKKATLLFPAATQSYPQYKTPTERRLRRRGAERAPSQYKDGLNDHADEDVFARGREREQYARIQDHA